MLVYFNFYLLLNKYEYTYFLRISTIDLENKLILSPAQERDLFKNRDKFDLVVYYDQDSTYNTSSNKFSSPSVSNGCNDLLLHLKNAIYVNDYKKNLKRPPVLLNGGFAAWRRFASDKWIEKSNTNSDKSKRNGVVISDNNPTSWAENFNNERYELTFDTSKFMIELPFHLYTQYIYIYRVF